MRIKDRNDHGPAPTLVDQEDSDPAADTLSALQAYDWPGNVRQLRNLMDWLLIMAPGADAIRADMLPPDVSSAAPALR